MKTTITSTTSNQTIVMIFRSETQRSRLLRLGGRLLDVRDNIQQLSTTLAECITELQALQQEDMDDRVADDSSLHSSEITVLFEYGDIVEVTNGSGEKGVVIRVTDRSVFVNFTSQPPAQPRRKSIDNVRLVRKLWMRHVENDEQVKYYNDEGPIV